MSTDRFSTGIGAMGFGMAGQIRMKMPPKAILLVNDSNQEACRNFVTKFGKHGPIEVVASAKAAAEKADTLISMVPGPSDVREVYLDPDRGVIAALSSPQASKKLVLECSTIDPTTTQEVGEALRQAGLGLYADAPVSVGRLRHCTEYPAANASSREG